jgi:hypothetical protein
MRRLRLRWSKDAWKVAKSPLIKLVVAQLVSPSLKFGLVAWSLHRFIACPLVRVQSMARGIVVGFTLVQKLLGRAMAWRFSVSTSSFHPVRYGVRSTEYGRSCMVDSPQQQPRLY